MPKNYTKEELENGRWVTMNGARVFIKDGETPEDAFARASGKSTKAEKKSYKDFDKKEDMAMELYKRTGINFRGDFRNVDKDTFAQTCETLEDLETKFHINGVSAEDVQGDRLDVVVTNEFDGTFESDDMKNAFACASLCKIELNPDSCQLNPQDLDSVYAEGTEGYRPFHPKGTTSKDIIAHESAHHMLDKKVWKMCERDYNKYQEIQKFLVDKSEYDAMGETTLPEIKTLFNKFDKVRKNYIKYLKADEEASKYLGFGLRDNAKLRHMANVEEFGRYGICKYASKNYHELVAESFADFYANGKEAKPLSRMICFEILNIKEAKL